MELREFLNNWADALAERGLIDEAGIIRVALAGYAERYLPAEPVTFDTLPGELEKLGYKWNDESTWMEFEWESEPLDAEQTEETREAIIVEFDGGAVTISKFIDEHDWCCTVQVKTTTNPADALELVKQLMKVAE